MLLGVGFGSWEKGEGEGGQESREGEKQRRREEGHKVKIESRRIEDDSKVHVQLRKN